MRKMSVGIVYLWAFATLGVLIHGAATGTIPVGTGQLLGFYGAVVAPWALLAFRWSRGTM